ncbi:MAG: hypothetical protein ACOC93_00170 [Planctomycetota bacterium]
MSTVHEPARVDLAALARLEESLAEVLRDAAEEVDRADCFDQEQRAEVYTILRTLRADSAEHRGAIDRLQAQQGEYVTDA